LANTLTSTVNGVASATAPIINTNALSLSGTNLTSTVNGVASTALDLQPLINAGTTVSNLLTGSNLTTTVNGVTGAPLDLLPLLTGSTTNTLSSAVNTLTNVTNGVSATAPIINTNTNSLTGSNLTTTINGVASTPLDLLPLLTGSTTNTQTWTKTGNLVNTTNGVVGTVTIGSGTIADFLGYDSTGKPVYQSLASAVTAGTTVSNTSLANNLTTTVNGVAATAVPIINSNTITSLANTLTSTVNGVASATAPIINTNALSLSGTNLTSTVNGVASTPVNLLPLLTGSTTNTLSSAVNTLTNVTNGVSATAPIINSNTITSLANTLTSTVNGVASATAPIINTNALSLSGTNLTSTVNGVASTPVNLLPLLTSATTNTLSSAVNTLTNVTNGVSATAPIINSNTITSSANTLTSTVNGVASATAPIINTNALSLSGTNLTSTVNGVASTALDLQPLINAGTTVSNLLTGSNLTTTVNGVTGAPLDLLPLLTGSTTNTLSSAVNTLTNVTNGVSATAPIINSNTITSLANTLTSTVNGVASATAPIINTNALSLSGTNLTSTVNGVASTPVNLLPLLTGSTTNTLSSAVNTLTNVTNGVSATAPIINSNTITSLANTLTSTVNGVASATAPIINTNALSLSGTNLTSTVNGVASTALDLQPLINAGTTNTLFSTVNTLTNTTNGVVAVANIINSNVLSINNSGQVVSTVNGIASNTLTLNDFWRSQTGVALPDGVNDNTENMNRVGSVGIGHNKTSNVGMLDVVSQTAASTLNLSNYGNPNLQNFNRYQGTLTTPTTVNVNSLINRMSFNGYDGSTLREGARIDALVESPTGANDMPTGLLFATSADGTANPIERLRISANGNVGIGTLGVANDLLQLTTGIANNSGLTLTNLISSSPVTAGAGAIGVDGNGKVVRVTSTGATSASNGLTLVGTDVRLGGSISTPTTISTTALNTLTISAGVVTGVKALTVQGDLKVTGVIDPIELQFSGTPLAGNAYAIRTLPGTTNPIYVTTDANNLNAFSVRRSDNNNNVFGVDTVNQRVGVGNITPQARLDVDGAMILRPVSLGNQAVNTTLVAASTIDISSMITINQSTVGVNLSLPAPSQTQAGRMLSIVNNGTQPITVGGAIVGNGTFSDYRWDGATWAIASSSGTGWSINGNSNTTAATNFIGTTNAQDIVYKANNIEGLRMLGGSSFVGSGFLTVNTINPGDLVLSGDVFFKNPGVGNTPSAFQWMLTSDNAAMYTKENSVDQSDYTFKFGDNAEFDQDRYVFWQSSYLGASLDKFPLVMSGNTTNMYSKYVGDNHITGALVANSSLLHANQSTARIGIKNTNPLYMLHVGNATTTIGSIARFENAGGNCTITPNTAGGVTCTSDIRKKTNVITSNTQELLAKINQIDVASYNMIGDPNGQKQIGFLAQNMEKIFPSLVITDDNGDKSVSYSGMTPILVAGVKQLDGKVSSIELKLSQLEAKLANTPSSGTTSFNGTTESLTVNQSATFNGMAKFLASAEFKNIKVSGDLETQGTIKVSDQVANSYVVKEGLIKQKFVFAKPKSKKPIINLTPTSIIDGGYAVVNTTNESFEIEFQKVQANSIEFNVLIFDK
jgi:trimeric autotransporter adhesin